MGLFDALNRVLGPSQTGSAAQGGYDTAKAWQDIQQRMNQQYEQQGNKALEGVPLVLNNETLQGIKKEAMDVSPVQRWQDQINAMMTSGNPMLQEAALKDMSNAYSKQADLAKPDHPNTYKEWLRLPASRRAELSYEDFLNSKKTKMFESAMDAPVKDYPEWVIKDPVTGEMRTPTPADAKTVGELYALNPIPHSKLNFTDTAKLSGLREGIKAVNDAESIIFNEDGSVNEAILNGVSLLDAAPKSWRSMGAKAYKYFNTDDTETVDKALDYLNSFDRALSPMLKTETGAAATAEETADMKLRFMPKSGDSKELIRKKMNAYRELANSILNYAEQNKFTTLSQANKILDKYLADETTPPPKPITQLPEGWTWEDEGDI